MNVVIENIAIELPDRYRQIETNINDAPGAYSFIRQTPTMACIVSLYVITTDKHIPFDDVPSVISGLHHNLADNQGLIEVNAGTTPLKRKYLYSITKTRNQAGIQYALTFQLGMFAGGRLIQIEIYGNELASFGLREEAVYTIAKRNGKIGTDGLTGWENDPYDPSFRHGFLMNLSESSFYDKVFPDHPLTEIRRLKDDLVADN
ncbi:hypothetical protein IKF15_02240 [Candidatus Saccharibacteria bacterium]|nr:hypothetical protein [Candidatus Saccharibacteria bacterium]